MSLHDALVAADPAKGVEVLLKLLSEAATGRDVSAATSEVIQVGGGAQVGAYARQAR